MLNKRCLPFNRFLLILIAGLLLPGLVLPALADVAPPDQAPGSNIGPDQSTQVRMLAEQVVLDIRPSQAGPQTNSLVTRLAEAEVTATFLMRNLGETHEDMQVRFPLEAPTGFGNLASVEGFSASVAGQPVVTTTISGPLQGPYGEETIQWAAFPVQFPAGQDVTITVSYLTRPTGYIPAARFDYVLETGAGWQGTIGSVDIIARLPYTATEENVLLGPYRTNDGYQTTPGGQFTGNEVRWHWDNLEPTRADNFNVYILLPQTWQRIVAARARVEANPGDIEALLALSEAYEAGVANRFPIESNDPYAALAEQALAQAIALQPDSAELHTRLARLMWEHVVMFTGPSSDPILQPVLAELYQALALNPEHEPALALLQEIRSWVDDPEALPVPSQSSGGAPQTLPQSGGPDSLFQAAVLVLAGLATAGLGAVLAGRSRLRM